MKKTHWMALAALLALVLTSPVAFADQAAPAATGTAIAAPADAPTGDVVADSQDVEFEAFIAELEGANDPQAKQACSGGSCSINFDCRIWCGSFGICHDASPGIPCSGWCECITP